MVASILARLGRRNAVEACVEANYPQVVAPPLYPLTLVFTFPATSGPARSAIGIADPQMLKTERLPAKRGWRGWTASSASHIKKQGSEP